ncbi:MAG: hypothetical protein EPN39_15395 [Chitinophagaceae bacterium]|nr:MAG: hypothetical protein EPN39_15395 [Chitinophagaceae bacterium]
MKCIVLILATTISLFSCNREVAMQYLKRQWTIETVQTASVFSFHQPTFYNSVQILFHHISAYFKKYLVKRTPIKLEYFRWFLQEYFKKYRQKNIPNNENLPPEKILAIVKRYLNNDFGMIDKPETCIY